jgi:hypothetical protein
MSRSASLLASSAFTSCFWCSTSFFVNFFSFVRSVRSLLDENHELEVFFASLGRTVSGEASRSWSNIACSSALPPSDLAGAASVDAASADATWSSGKFSGVVSRNFLAASFDFASTFSAIRCSFCAFSSAAAATSASAFANARFSNSSLYPGTASVGLSHMVEPSSML